MSDTTVRRKLAVEWLGDVIAAIRDGRTADRDKLMGASGLQTCAWCGFLSASTGRCPRCGRPPLR